MVLPALLWSKNCDYGANRRISQYPTPAAQKNGIIGRLSRIEMKSKTILIMNSRNGIRDTI
jgi:hypothetical protein